jgi:phosphoribosylformylglycinamidine cyclo-ligase
MGTRVKTYTQAGVDYGAMDPIKVLAQKTAKSTSKMLKEFGMNEVSASRGESAYVWEEPNCYRALVIEGLGTKNLVADVVRKFSGKTHYDSIAQDTVAMIVNDLIVVGALPQVVNAYFAIGDSRWLLDKERASDLICGWAEACKKSGAAWGGGETPTLKGIIDPKTIDLGGSTVGIIKPKRNLVLGDKLKNGDAIVLVESSGIHANGITFVRSLAEKSPKIYQTKLPNGRTFGEAILTPTHLYVSLVREVIKAKVDVHYMTNITGHGWRKLMRASKNLSYVIREIPVPQPEFIFMQKCAGVSDKEMYGNFNMGTGFAIYVPKSHAQKVVKIAAAQNLKAWVAGEVKTGPKQVIIKPKNITFSGDSLGVRS